MYKSHHPWRGSVPGVQTLDPIASTRSAGFAAYLETLTPAERRQIEAAERAYVLKTNAPAGAAQTIATDFAESMIGANEARPPEYHGFVA